MSKQMLVVTVCFLCAVLVTALSVLVSTLWTYGTATDFVVYITTFVLAAYAVTFYPTS